MRWSPAAHAAALAFLLAGCAGGGADGGRAAGPAQCTLAYPDGTPVSCEGSAFSDVAVTAPPPPQTGWLCKDDNVGDTGNRHQIWMESATGQLGIAWDYTAAPLGQPAIVFATLYQADQDQGLVVPYQDVGFMAFPQAPRSTPMEIHIIAYSFQLHSNEVDAFDPANWHPAVGEARMLVSRFGVDPWVAWRYEHEGTVREFDSMAPTESEAGAPIWRPRGGLVEPKAGEPEVPALYMVVSGGGAKYPGRDPLQMRANPGFCYAEDLPVRGFAADTPSVGPQLRNH